MPARVIDHPTQCLSRTMLPVSATFDEHGEAESTGISFTDYNFMRVQEHKASGERRLDCPSWVLNDAHLRSVLIEYLLSRAGVSKKKRDELHLFSERDLVLFAMQKFRDNESNLIARYVKFEDEFLLHLKCASPFCLKRCKLLRRYLASLDSQICLQRNPHRFWKVIFCYYRRRLDSVGVAAEVHLMPSTVRQTLRRMNKCAERLGYAAPVERQNRRRKAKCKI